MKRLKLLLVCIVGAMSICAKCEFEEDELPRYDAQWYIKNSTDKILIATYPYYYSKQPYDRSVAPGDSLMVYRSDFLVRDNIKPYFDYWPKSAADWYGEDLNLRVLSKDSFLLKEWTYLEKDQPGRQFFSEPYWTHYDVFITRDEFETTTDIWVFDILSEDITQTES